MVKTKMYKRIQQLKVQGLSINKISNELGLDRKTVRKYYRMNESDYLEYQKELESRFKILDPYMNEIIKIYEANNNIKLNMAGVYDYLCELHGELPCTEKTLRNFIRYLAETGKLHILKNARHYIKVPEMPFGRQLQLDFGAHTTQSGLKIYIFAAVLSSSRYKCVFFHDKPFTSQSLIDYLLDCFDFIGGIPEEIVIDQDKIMVVSENAGDILYTKDFGIFKEEMGFSMYVCRKSDPESKGKVENLVKFVKHSFLAIRDFKSLDESRLSLSNWLIRRANGKISYSTGKIPAVIHREEKKHLKPLKNSIFRKNRLIYREERQVDDNSLFAHQSSKYSVPDRYQKRTVEIYTTDKEIFVYDPQTGEQIANHPLSLIPGKKIIIRSHFRQNHRNLEELKSEIESLYELCEWKSFVNNCFTSFPRYKRDQYLLCKKYFSIQIDKNVLKSSLELCLENQSYSFNDLNIAYQSLISLSLQKDNKVTPVTINPINHSYQRVYVGKRKIEEYQRNMEVKKQ